MRIAQFSLLFSLLTLPITSLGINSSSVLGLSARVQLAEDIAVKLAFVGFTETSIDKQTLEAQLGQAAKQIKYEYYFIPADGLYSLLNSVKRTGTYTNASASVTVHFYDVAAVQKFVASSQGLIGGSPERGYTIFLADLSRLPSPHYLTVEQQNHDTKRNWKSYFKEELYRPVTDFMPAWGGDLRYFFIDLSAGPVLINSTSEQLHRFDPLATRFPYTSSDSRARSELTSYIVSHVRGITESLLALKPTQSVGYKLTHELILQFLVEELKPEDEALIDRAFNAQLVLGAFQKLAPYSSWKVQKVIKPLEGELLQLVKKGKIDANALDLTDIAAYLLSNKDEFGKSDEKVGKYVTFILVLKDERLGVLQGRTLTGVTLGEVNLLVQSRRLLAERGITRDVIHENGHSVGLRHSHDNGYWIADFTPSVMSHLTFGYEFSVFDADFLQRAYTQQLYTSAVGLQGTLESKLKDRFVSQPISQRIKKANDLIDEAARLYNVMLYAQAAGLASSAVTVTTQTLDLITYLPPLSLFYGGIVFSLVSFVLAAFAVWKKRSQQRVETN